MPDADERHSRRDERNRLAHEIAELSARIDAAIYELLVRIRRFDELEGWAGATSYAEWLSWRANLAPGTAREYVRVAYALATLPKISDALRRDRISYSKVRAMTRVATPATEERLLHLAHQGTAAHLERIVRAWRLCDRQHEGREDRARRRHHSLSIYPDADGMFVVRGRLTPEVGAVVCRALDAASEQLRQEAKDAETQNVEEATPARRRADALGLLAESALAATLDPGTAGDRYQVLVHVDQETLREDVSAETPVTDGRNDENVSAETPKACDGRDRHVSAETPVAGGADSGNVPADTRMTEGRSGTDVSAETSMTACDGQKSDTRSNAPRVSAETSPTGGQAALEEAGGIRVSAKASPTGGQAALEEGGGIRVSAETSRRLACDAGKVLLRHDAAGAILDVGRKTRTISPALRRALASRDRHCRFPGCEARRCDAHHVRHWADGGATKLENLVLLCRRHHRAVHEEGFGLTLDAKGEPQFTQPNGWPLPMVPAAPAWTGDPLAPTNGTLARNGIVIDSTTSLPNWCGEGLDLPYVISVAWRPGDNPGAEDAA